MIQLAASENRKTVAFAISPISPWRCRGTERVTASFMPCGVRRSIPSVPKIGPYGKLSCNLITAICFTPNITYWGDHIASDTSRSFFSSNYVWKSINGCFGGWHVGLEGSPTVVEGSTDVNILRADKLEWMDIIHVSNWTYRTTSFADIWECGLNGVIRSNLRIWISILRIQRHCTTLTVSISMTVLNPFSDKKLIGARKFPAAPIERL